MYAVPSRKWSSTAHDARVLEPGQQPRLDLEARRLLLVEQALDRHLGAVLRFAWRGGPPPSRRRRWRCRRRSRRHAKSFPPAPGEDKVGGKGHGGLAAGSPRRLAARAARPPRGRGRGTGLPRLRDGDGQQRIHPLGRGVERVVLGRGTMADLRLGWDPEVSRAHAELNLQGRLLVRLRRRPVGERQRGSTASCCAAAGASTTATRCASAARSSPSARRPRPARSRPSGPAAASRRASRTPSAACSSRSRGRTARARGSPPRRPTRDIAAECVITVDAVKAHLRALFDRFGNRRPAAEPQARAARGAGLPVRRPQRARAVRRLVVLTLLALGVIAAPAQATVAAARDLRRRTGVDADDQQRRQRGHRVHALHRRQRRHGDARQRPGHAAAAAHRVRPPRASTSRRVPTPCSRSGPPRRIPTTAAARSSSRRRARLAPT